MFKNKRGFLLWPVMMAVFVSVLLLSGLSVWLAGDVRLTNRMIAREEALRIAEAGIDYYRWLLAHYPDHYIDNPGPIQKEFRDSEGDLKGFFSLSITPPLAGSSVIKINSEGISYIKEREIKRVIEVSLGIPSLARYAVIANSNMRFGEGTEIFGLIHSNQGIRFDGLAHSLVTSAVVDYDDPDHSGGREFGVHTHIHPVDPLPPADIPWRSDVFLAGRKFPVPAIDFVGIIYDLAVMKIRSQEEGHYISSSDSFGYRILLKEDNSYDLFKVNSLTLLPSQCNNTLEQTDWSSWSIASGGEDFLGNFPFPDNNLIFVEDDVWVEGKIDKARITITAARFPDSPNNRASIMVNNDILYTNYDGQDVIALIAQNNINIGWLSSSDLEINAALIAQNGRVGRHYYRPPSYTSVYCGPNHIKNKISLYGTIITNSRYGFAYTDGTGYQIREIYYDNNLFYNPPPFFPAFADNYDIISWREVE